MQGIFLILSVFIVFISGYWLHLLGIPYGKLMLALHKFLALAALITICVMMYHSIKGSQLQTLTLIVLIVTTVFVVATFASGGITSANEGTLPVMLWLHRILPYFTTALLVWCVYLTSRVNS